MEAIAFDTRIGICTLTWSAEKITSLSLPQVHSTDADEAERGEALPAFVSNAIGDVRELLKGERRELLEIPVSIDALPAFTRRVLEQCRRIRWGQVQTYGEVAAACGKPRGAQAVGQALGRNPIALIIPCHRVVAAGNSLGGFSAPGGTQTKKLLLGLEQAL